MQTDTPTTLDQLRTLIDERISLKLQEGLSVSSLNITGNLTVNGNTSLQGCTYKGIELPNIPSNNRYQGSNPLSSSTEDTPEFWRNHNGIYWISVAGILLNQPYQYGTLITYNKDNSLEISQVFIQHPNGYTFIRGANANGWNGNGTNTWRRLDNV